MIYARAALRGVINQGLGAPSEQVASTMQLNGPTSYDWGVTNRKGLAKLGGTLFTLGQGGAWCSIDVATNSVLNTGTTQANVDVTADPLNQLVARIEPSRVMLIEGTPPGGSYNLNTTTGQVAGGFINGDLAVLSGTATPTLRIYDGYSVSEKSSVTVPNITATQICGVAWTGNYLVIGTGTYGGSYCYIYEGLDVSVPVRTIPLSGTLRGVEWDLQAQQLMLMYSSWQVDWLVNTPL